jgi:hypothetical protein
MLGPALFLIAILFLTASVAIAGIGAFARASIQNATTTVIHTALNHAIHSYAANVAAQVANQEDQAYQTARLLPTDYGAIQPVSALQNPGTIVAPAAVTEQISSYYVTETFATTGAPPSCGNPAQQGLSDVVTAAQCSRWIWETRMSGSVDIAVFSAPPGTAGSALLAERTETITFRLFADAPFVAIVGLKDGDARDPTTDDVNAISPHEGDLGGYSSVTGPMVDDPTHPVDDTTIHVYYECHNPNPNVTCPGQPFPAGDQPQNLHWQNGNPTH